MEFSDKYPDLLLAGGKGGVVSLFHLNGNLSNSENKNVIISFKAHQKWISDVKFLSENICNKVDSNTQSIPIITSSDDGFIKVWDLGKCRKNSQSGFEEPKLIYKNNNIHDKGIFSMDEVNGLILTGSKDRSIVLSKLALSSTLTPSFEILSTFNHHYNVVKSVNWKRTLNNENPVIFASGGQDRMVCIKDIRTNDTDNAELSIANAHDGGVHTVLWNPYFNSSENDQENLEKNHNMLMTAGMDPFIKVYDVRKLTKNSSDEANSANPLFIFKGHTSNHIKKITSINSPKFLSNETIVTTGEGNDNISLYCLKTGLTLSRGELPEKPITLAINDINKTKNLAVSCKSGSIYILHSNN